METKVVFPDEDAFVVTPIDGGNMIRCWIAVEELIGSKSDGPGAYFRGICDQFGVVELQERVAQHYPVLCDVFWGVHNTLIREGVTMSFGDEFAKLIFRKAHDLIDECDQPELDLLSLIADDPEVIAQEIIEGIQLKISSKLLA